MGVVYEYLWAVFVYWWVWLMTTILFGVDKFLEWLFPTYRDWLNQTFSLKTRRRAFWIATLALVFFASFLAWKDERATRLKSQEDSQKALAAAHQENAHLKGQLQARSESELGKKLQAQEVVIARLRQQVEPRTVTDEQRKNMVEVLKKVPPGKTRNLRFEVPSSCHECRGFADDIGAAWRGFSDWQLKGTLNVHLDSHLNGVSVVTNLLQCPSDEVRLISEVLQAGEIRHSFRPVTEKDKKVLAAHPDLCLIVVGNKPQQ